MTDRRQSLSRREFVCGLALASTAELHGLQPKPVAAEPPPETTTLRLPKRPSVCQAPRYFAEDLLRSEGFTAVRYLEQGAAVAALEAVASGELDMTSNFIGPTIIRIDAGDAIVVLAGLHTGCFELFGTGQVRTIRDLKGKTVAVPDLGSPEHVFLSSMMAHVGLDPRRDTTWITRSRTEAMPLLAEGKIDAYLGFPPDPQERRRSGMCSSTATWTGPGPSISAAWLWQIGSSSGSTRSPLSGRFVRC